MNTEPIEVTEANCRTLWEVRDTGQTHVKVWYGKSERARFNYLFRDAIQAATWLEDVLYNARQNEADKRKRAEKKKAARDGFRMPWKAGDIFVNSWGYDQTNVDWYQVVRTTKRSVILRPICAAFVGPEGFMCDYAVPLPGRFKGGEIRKNVQFFDDGKPYLPTKYGWLGEWDGKPRYVSWYA